MRSTDSGVMFLALDSILEARLLWSFLDWHDSLSFGLQGVLIREGFPLVYRFAKSIGSALAV